MTAEVAKKVSSRALDQKWSHLGMGGARSEELMRGLANVALRGEATARWMRTFVVGDLDIAAMPSKTQAVMRDAVQRIAGEPNRIRLELRDLAKNGASREEALTSLLEQHRPISQREMAALDVLESRPRRTEPEVFVARDEVLRHVRDVSDYPNITSNDVLAVKADLTRLLSDKRAEMHALGTELLKAHFPFDDIVDDKILKAASAGAESVAEQAWRAYARGGINAPEIRVAANRMAAGTGKKLLSELDAPVAYLARLRAKANRRSVLQKLVEQGYATSDPSTIAALEHLLNGVPAKAGHPFPESQLAHAENLIERWGLRPGTYTALESLEGGTLPRGLVEELRRASARGVRITPQGLDSTVFRWLHRLYKIGMTSLIPAFTLASNVGLPYMLAYNRGAKGLASAMFTGAAHPGLVLDLSQRLTASWAARRAGEAVLPLFRNNDVARLVFKDDFGNLYSIDELERAMSEGGAGEVLQSQINAQALAEDVDRYFTGWRAMLTEGRPVAAGDALLADFAEALGSVSAVPEQFARTSVYLDVLKRTGDLDEAARAARGAAYDYTRLSPADRWLSANGVVFWSFRRKDLDAFIRNVFDNPSRVGAQLRMAQRQPDAWGDRDTEWLKSQLTASDLQRLKLWQTEGASGRRVDVATGGVNNAVSGLQSWAAIFGLPYDVGESARELFGGLAPGPAAGFEAVTGVDPRSAMRISPERGNLIPPEMLDGATGGLIRAAFNPKPVILEARHADMAYETRMGRYYGWAPADDRVALWRNLYRLAPRAFDLYYKQVPRIVDVDLVSPADSQRVTLFPQERARPDTTRMLDLLEAMGARVDPVLSDIEQRNVLMTRQAGPARAEIRETQDLLP